MRVALYARVSTSDQNCSLQLQELRSFIERKGWKNSGEFVDQGISGAKASRPQLDLLKKQARLAHYDAVVVWKLDRWGRSLQDCINSIQELSSLKVRFLAVTQGIDTGDDTPTSKLMLQLFAAFAEFERELIRERVKAGVSAAKSRGVEWGRRRAVFDRQKAEDLQKQGMSVRKMAEELGVSKGVVQRFLKGGAFSSDTSQRP